MRINRLFRKIKRLLGKTKKLLRKYFKPVALKQGVWRVFYFPM